VKGPWNGNEKCTKNRNERGGGQSGELKCKIESFLKTQTSGRESELGRVTGKSDRTRCREIFIH
jgi:hypothetical protein